MSGCQQCHIDLSFFTIYTDIYTLMVWLYKSRIRMYLKECQMYEEQDPTRAAEPEELIAGLDDGSPLDDARSVLDLFCHLHDNNLELGPNPQEDLRKTNDMTRLNQYIATGAIGLAVPFGKENSH
jgi:hypothetical protein